MVTQNFTEHATITLSSCYAGNGIAKAFSSYFNVPVYASGGGVNYNQDGSMYTSWRSPLDSFGWVGTNLEGLENRLTAKRDCCWGEEEASKLHF